MPEVADAPQQTGPIAVYEATGYTGRLVAAELRRRGAEIALAGRNRAKLVILAEDLGGQIAIRDASLDDPTALSELLEPCAAVIACAGPFLKHGEPVLAAAIEARAHDLDTTGEQPFMRKVFGAYGRKAGRAGVALVTAMGFDYAPGDMIAALTAEGMEPLDEIVLAYAVQGFGVTRGTALSALGMMAGGDAGRRDGEGLRPPREASAEVAGTFRTRSAASGCCGTRPASTSPCRGTSGRGGRELLPTASTIVPPAARPPGRPARHGAPPARGANAAPGGRWRRPSTACLTAQARRAAAAPASQSSAVGSPELPAGGGKGDGR